MSMDTNSTAIELSELWNIQDSLLQAYRGIFITAESVIFAVSSIVLATPRPWFAVPLIVLGTYLIKIWISVCRARGLAVAFIHWMIRRQEDGENINKPYARLREFQTSRTYNGIDVLEDPDFKSLTRSKTRRRMDFEVPLVFGLMWFGLLTFFLADIWAVFPCIYSCL